MTGAPRLAYQKRMSNAQKMIEAALSGRLDPHRIPHHVAIICDGNGRWATQRGLLRAVGHQQGYLAVRQAVRDASDLGVKVLTLYAFSIENWSRPKTETDALMRLFEYGAKKELRELHQNGVRMKFSGRIGELPISLQDKLRKNEEVTASNTGLTLNICLNYSGREEILHATRRLVELACQQQLCEKDVTAELFAQGLYTAGLPDPDLLIRTAGEMRVSNYLLWQIAYAEIWVTPDAWPDFSTRHLIEAIADYQTRVRKFGGVTNLPAT